MTALKRNLILALCFITPFFCVVVLALHYERGVLQQQHNHDLRQAIKNDDLRGVVVALREGAAPNCREVARDKRSFWERARQWFRPLPYNGPPLRSALTIAVGRDADAYGWGASPAQRLPILKALHEAGAIAEGDAPENRPQRDALIKDVDTPNALSTPASWIENTGGARDGLQTFMREKGMSAEAYRALGQVWLNSDYYAEAERCFEIAQRWQPQDGKSAEGRTRAQNALDASIAVNGLRTDKRLVIAARLYSEQPGRRLWITLCINGEGYRYSGPRPARLALYAEQGGRFRLCDEADTLYNGRAALAIARFTGRPAPEIALVEQEDPGDSPATNLSVYAVRAERLRRIFRMDSAGDSSLQPGRNGRYDAVADDGCMDYNPEDKPPPWYSTTYIFNGKTFVPARRVQVAKPCGQ